MNYSIWNCSVVTWVPKASGFDAQKTEKLLLSPRTAIWVLCFWWRAVSPSNENYWDYGKLVLSRPYRVTRNAAKLQDLERLHWECELRNAVVQFSWAEEFWSSLGKIERSRCYSIYFFSKNIFDCLWITVNLSVTLSRVKRNTILLWDITKGMGKHFGSSRLD